MNMKYPTTRTTEPINSGNHRVLLRERETRRRRHLVASPLATEEEEPETSKAQRELSRWTAEANETTSMSSQSFSPGENGKAKGLISSPLVGPQPRPKEDALKSILDKVQGMMLVLNSQQQPMTKKNSHLLTPPVDQPVRHQRRDPQEDRWSSSSSSRSGGMMLDWGLTLPKRSCIAENGNGDSTVDKITLDDTYSRREESRSQQGLVPWEKMNRGGEMIASSRKSEDESKRSDLSTSPHITPSSGDNFDMGYPKPLKPLSFTKNQITDSPRKPRRSRSCLPMIESTIPEEPDDLDEDCEDGLVNNFSRGSWLSTYDHADGSSSTL